MRGRRGGGKERGALRRSHEADWRGSHIQSNGGTPYPSSPVVTALCKVEVARQARPELMQQAHVEQSLRVVVLGRLAVHLHRGNEQQYSGVGNDCAGQGWRPCTADTRHGHGCLHLTAQDNKAAPGSLPHSISPQSSQKSLPACSVASALFPSGPPQAPQKTPTWAARLQSRGTPLPYQ